MNTESTKGWRAIRYYREHKAPKIMQLMVKYSRGIIKDSEQAGYILLDLGIIIFIISLYFWFK